ncbi:S-adenosylmethionine decarboxylase [Paenibacillus turpanensis]|uniref:S-adenosylmethionine decarboxylase n=1 Tax=Paenibacillus turpanensis TaxID=2689078 RepID=UPI0014091912|nr:S-adenosylmethionine decarboxylase [Paenibacillus turpanensis]
MRKKRVMVWIVALGLFALTVFQLVQNSSEKRSVGDAPYLLFQVSWFQVEMLNSVMQGSTAAGSTNALEELKNQAYSVSYSHDRLALAFGQERIPPLQSASAIVQYITRLQIGGDRPLKKEETQVLVTLSERLQKLYEAYGALVSENGQVIKSQKDKIIQIDAEMAELLKQKMLQ